MKEVLSKRFWRDVTKTFYEALEGPPPKPPAEVKVPDSKAADTKPSPDGQVSSTEAGAPSKAP